MIPKVKDLIIAIVKHTGDPLAPLCLQELNKKLDWFGKTTANLASEVKVKEFEDRVLRLFTEEELCSYSWAVFVASCAKVSVQEFVKACVEGREKEK